MSSDDFSPPVSPTTDSQNDLSDLEQGTDGLVCLPERLFLPTLKSDEGDVRACTFFFVRHVLLDSYGPPDDGFPSELEPSSIPESTSGYEPFTAEVQDQISTEPTPNPDPPEMSTETFTVSSPTQSSNDGSQDNDSLSPTTEAPPAEGEGA